MSKNRIIIPITLLSIFYLGSIIFFIWNIVYTKNFKVSLSWIAFFLFSIIVAINTYKNLKEYKKNNN